MSAGFFGGYTQPTYLINGSTILEEDRTPELDHYGHVQKHISEEELIAIEHGKTCLTCRSSGGSRQPKCAACGAVSCDLARLRNYCWGCNHIACPRHQFWPTRKHSPEDHGPATGTMKYPKKWLKRRAA